MQSSFSGNLTCGIQKAAVYPASHGLRSEPPLAIFFSNIDKVTSVSKTLQCRHTGHQMAQSAQKNSEEPHPRK
jgi:hypothetical protein